MLSLSDLLVNANKRVDDFHEMQRLGVHCNTGEFVPAGVHYPEITDYPDINYDDMYKGYTMPEDGLLDVYVHFPFCVRRCIYCHYPSFYNSSDSEKDEYIDYLEKEIDVYQRTLNIDKIKVRVAMIGGGTPTDLTPAQLNRFLKIFTSKCDMSHIQQFNYDLSPATIIGKDGLERLKILKDYGVNRIAIGIQSMNDKILKSMNRPHNKAEAIEAVHNSISMGFTTNVEFIYGYPGQTVESWYEELKEMVLMEAHEFQFYRLMVNAYGDQQGIIKYTKELINNSPSPEDAMRMKQMVIDYLADFGYSENLRRVFTKKRSDLSLYAFNQCCMLHDQIALGLTGFSSLRDRFVLNTHIYNDYKNYIDNSKLPYNRGFVRNTEEQQRWAFILPLKTYFVRKKYYKKFTGVNIEDTKIYHIIQKLKAHDLIYEDDNTIRLTKKGSFFADEISVCFYAHNFIPREKELYNDGELSPYILNP